MAFFLFPRTWRADCQVCCELDVLSHCILKAKSPLVLLRLTFSINNETSALFSFLVNLSAWISCRHLKIHTLKTLAILFLFFPTPTLAVLPSSVNMTRNLQNYPNRESGGCHSFISLKSLKCWLALILPSASLWMCILSRFHCQYPCSGPHSSSLCY